TVIGSLVITSPTARFARSGNSESASATSRSVSTPTGLLSWTIGTAPQSASRKIITASSTVLNGEHVRGDAVITSAAVRVAVGGMGGGPPWVGITTESSRKPRTDSRLEVHLVDRVL